MTNTEMLYLAKCRKLIEEKLEWRPAEEWRNFEFAELSEKIFDATGINLSATTLKRIFGKVNYQSLPSSATLNTLSIFLGYASWMDFKSKVHLSEVRDEEPQVKAGSKPQIRKRILIVACSMLAVSALLGFIFLPKSHASLLPGANVVLFKSHSISEGLPNTVVFNMDGSQINSDNFWIQQSWDSTKTIYLKKGQSEATGFYYYPGYYRAKLIVGGKIIKEHDVFIRSDKWMATFDHEPVPTYIKPADLILNNKMTIDDSVLKEAAKFEQQTFLTYHLVRPFNGVKTDNFSLETEIKNTYDEGAAVCRTVKIYVLGTNGVFIIPFSIPGCVGDIDLKLYKTYLEGRCNDLSMFGTDLSVWNKVRLETKDKHVRIFLNDHLIKEQDYEADAGAITGMRFSFLGAGEVKYVHLFDGEGKNIYSEDFGGK